MYNKQRRKEEHEANLAKKEEGGEAPDEAQLGLLPIFITTPIDKFSKWTRGTPNPFIWERIVSYASRSLQAVLPFVENPEQGNWKVFQSVLSSFLILIFFFFLDDFPNADQETL